MTPVVPADEEQPWDRVSAVPASGIADGKVDGSRDTGSRRAM